MDRKRLWKIENVLREIKNKLIPRSYNSSIFLEAGWVLNYIKEKRPQIEILNNIEDRKLILMELKNKGIIRNLHTPNTLEEPYKLAITKKFQPYFSRIEKQYKKAADAYRASLTEKEINIDRAIPNPSCSVKKGLLYLSLPYLKEKIKIGNEKSMKALLLKDLLSHFGALKTEEALLDILNKKTTNIASLIKELQKEIGPYQKGKKVHLTFKIERRGVRAFYKNKKVG